MIALADDNDDDVANTDDDDVDDKDSGGGGCSKRWSGSHIVQSLFGFSTVCVFNVFSSAVEVVKSDDNDEDSGSSEKWSGSHIVQSLTWTQQIFLHYKLSGNEVMDGRRGKSANMKREKNKWYNDNVPTKSDKTKH